MSTIATICARGGSTGVPGKNIRVLQGRPLIAHTIGQALACPEIDGVYVSTDSAEIAEVAERFGATVLGLRPAELATDEAPKLPVIRHLVEAVEASGATVRRIVDLDPTSPLREVADISACLGLLDARTDLVITGYLSDKNPYFNMVEEREGGVFRPVVHTGRDVVARQLAPRVYAMNGSVYCWWRETFSESLWAGRTRLHEMPRERSVDIDHELDWKLVELLLAERP
ncbi:acylneuraminate cytidylyltransferase family protein [Leucobacter weissii]|uniref:Acylneuraminate cytidylyltransferase family protein n=1 Tax=Leucobacter weissii TaxID=1983706 RepID=A0A939MIF0_9MICO|nr:acylneuraminate cytidylyltransferase family protein [Leucobacter weissii]